MSCQGLLARGNLLFEHDLFQEPVAIFPDHALCASVARAVPRTAILRLETGAALGRRGTASADIDAAHLETAVDRFAGCHCREGSARRDRAGVGDLVAYDRDVWADDDFLFTVLVLNGDQWSIHAGYGGLVMVELGAPSQGRCPSPVPRMDSAKM